MTVMHDLNAYLTERLTLAAREILEVVGNTILEYQEETSRMMRENEELRQRLREIGAQNNLMSDSCCPFAPPVCSGAAPQGQQAHVLQCISVLEEDREPQQTDIKQEFPEQHESKPEQGVVDLNKQASALTCAGNPSEHRFLQTSLPFEEKTEEVGCLPHMLPDQIKSEPDELDYSTQEHRIFSQRLNRINNGSNTAESENLVDMNWMESGGVMPELNEQDSGREVCEIPVAGASKHVPCTLLRAEKEDDKPTFASKAAQESGITNSSLWKTVFKVKRPLANKEKTARHRQRVNADPAARQEYLARRKESYQRRKREGLIKYIKSSELREKERKKRREKWRAASRSYREKKKMSDDVSDHTPPSAEN